MSHYVVVVLGDIGRSPRMQNHATCLSRIPGSTVHLVGYMDSPLFEELQKAQNIKIHSIKPFYTLPRILFPIYAPLKILWLLLQLFALIFTIPRFELLLAQNPPSMPTIPFCWLLTLIKGKRFVIDWHNLGYSILECNHTHHIIVSIARVLELFFGRFASAHITVTNALQKFLKDQKINSSVVYDRPSSIFKPDRSRREEFAKKLDIDNSTPWIVSSTSWTPDEDIGILLSVADILDDFLKENGQIDITFIITGKGNNKWFETEVKGRNYVHVAFKLPFFERYEDYAAFMGCCDIGVSLHKSSSGIDLPMKGLDMIGAGLPLLSVKYGCINELVQETHNGLLFENAEELAEILKKLLVSKEIDLEKLRNGAIQSGEKKWENIWEESAKPVLIPK